MQIFPHEYKDTSINHLNQAFMREHIETVKVGLCAPWHAHSFYAMEYELIIGHGKDYGFTWWVRLVT